MKVIACLFCDKATGHSILAGREFAIALLSRLLETFWRACGAAAAEVFLEIPDQVAPHLAVDPDPIEDLLEVFRDGRCFSAAESLFACPFEQLQVVQDVHPEKALVAGPHAAGAGFCARFAAFVERERRQPGVAKDR